MVVLTFTDTGPKILTLILLPLGFVPYLASIHLIEPWLETRNARKNQPPEE